MKLRRLRAEDIAACDLVICAARGALTELLPALRRGSAAVIDVSGALETDPRCPCSSPESLRRSRPRRAPTFVAIPRGVAAGLGLALAPFARAGCLRRATAVTLESASGAGIAGVGELTDHTVQVLNRMSGERSESEVFAQSLAFDCLPQIGALEPTATPRTRSRSRACSAPASREPISRSSSRASASPPWAAASPPFTSSSRSHSSLDEVRALLGSQRSITLLPRHELPTPRAALGHDDVAVGRLRASGARVAFVLALNDLRLGAALGVVGAAEALQL